jgi:hypothetical protein
MSAGRPPYSRITLALTLVTILALVALDYWATLA